MSLRITTERYEMLVSEIRNSLDKINTDQKITGYQLRVFIAVDNETQTYYQTSNHQSFPIKDLKGRITPFLFSFKSNFAIAKAVGKEKIEVCVTFWMKTHDQSYMYRQAYLRQKPDSFSNGVNSRGFLTYPNNRIHDSNESKRFNIDEEGNFFEPVDYFDRSALATSSCMVL